MNLKLMKFIKKLNFIKVYIVTSFILNRKKEKFISRKELINFTEFLSLSERK